MFLLLAMLGHVCRLGAQASLDQRDATAGGVSATTRGGGRGDLLSPRLRALRFLEGRTLPSGVFPAQALGQARGQQLELVKEQALRPRTSSLTASWQPLGPMQVASLQYGNVTGRVTSIAIDPADPSGNTVYFGTTGGGVWKSTNAAGTAGSVRFTPLTDTLPVFSPNSGSAAIPSLSLGALALWNGVLLAGTGDPNDATDSYYGGGILRSADGGLTWTLISESHDGANGNHSFAGLGFAGFAFSSTTPGLVVAALSQSAEGTIVNAPDVINSAMGLYYSTDSGVTWQMSSVYDGGQIVQRPLAAGGVQGGNAATAVVWNPVRQRFYAAVRYHGYYESADGISWTRLSTQPSPALTLTACPTNPGSTGNTSCPIFRGALAVQAASGDMFALTIDGGNRDQGLYRDICSSSGSSCASPVPTFTSQLNSLPLEEGNGSTVIREADYNLSLAAVPAGADTILFAGTLDLFRCTLATGCSLRNTTNSVNACNAPAKVAPSQHAIATLATSSLPLVYVGNDGGLWRSTDGVNQQSGACSADDANHFQNLNGGLGSLAEIVSFAQHPSDAATLITGLGANGTAATSTAPSSPWPQLSAGEGGTVALDAQNPLLWTISTAAGIALRQCANGPACTSADFTGPPGIGLTQTSGDRALIDAPWLLDPQLTSSVVLGTCRVWRGPADDGSLWSSANVLSTMLAGSQNPSCSGSNPLLRSLGAGGPPSSAGTSANAGSTVLYAGMAGSLDGGLGAAGHLFATFHGATAGTSTNWTDLALSPVTNDFSSNHQFNPGGFDVSSIAVDPHDSTGQTVYATIMGFAGNGINAAHLYRSVDGGAHWSNISSNLPNAPANGVVVDPGDANTVYVALDTGVYVTTNVTGCTAANCWSLYGTGLPNAPVVQLAASAAMPTGDGRVGELRAATYGRGLWQLPLLTAAVPVQPAMTLAPNALIFPSQAVSTVSSAQTITVTNTGAAPLNVTRIATTGDFNETGTCVGASIGVNGTCSIAVSFLPSATGARSGVLTVYGNVAGGQATAALSGTGGQAASLVLNPIAIVFPATTVGASSMPQNITLSNTGSTSATIGSVTVTGDFQLQANTCGSTLGSGDGCSVAITFRPTGSGTRGGSVTFTDSVGVQTASLTGAGTSPATDLLSPLALSFAAQPLNSASALQQVTLTNSGDEPLTLISAQITGLPGQMPSFTAVNGCGNSLNGHSSCAIGVAFDPQSLGPLTGTLTVADAFRAQTVSLYGTGSAPAGISLSPASPLSFPNTGVAASSAPQTVTLTNNGGVAVAVPTPALTGDFVLVPGSDTCPADLAGGSTCTFQLLFTPRAAGPRMGTFALPAGAGVSPTLSLNGIGIDFTLSADGVTSASVPNGQTAYYPLLLTSASDVPGVASFTCAGAPSNASCNVNPASVALGSTTLVTVALDTGVAASARVQQESPERGLGWPLFASTLPFGLLLIPGVRGRRRERRIWLVMVLAAAVLSCSMGCGSGRTIPIPATSPGTTPTPTAVTPSGTYAIVVAATSNGVTRTVNLSLTVQ